MSTLEEFSDCKACDGSGMWVEDGASGTCQQCGPCTICGGEAWQDSDDPLWDGADYVPCRACNGTGQGKHQWIW